MAFVCYNCNRKRPDQCFAGILAEKKICWFCAPYVDEQDIGSLIKFDGQGKGTRKKYRLRDKNK